MEWGGVTPRPGVGEAADCRRGGNRARAGKVTAATTLASGCPTAVRYASAGFVTIVTNHSRLLRRRPWRVSLSHPTQPAGLPPQARPRNQRLGSYRRAVDVHTPCKG